jgi:hypothetical protein
LGVVCAVAAFAAVRAWFAPVRAAAVAKLSVDTQPTGAELLIDGQPRGRTPATFSIDPGAHTLAVRSSGVERVAQLTLAAGAQVAQYFELTANTPAVAPGRLSIVTDPPGLRVAVTDTRAASRRSSRTISRLESTPSRSFRTRAWPGGR